MHSQTSLHKDLKGRLRKFWDSQPIYWDPLMREDCVGADLREKAASFIPKGSDILDVACGCAANATWLDSRGKYLGADVSLSGLRRAQASGVRLVCADAEGLPFADGSFDAVFSTYALEHSVSPAQMLREMVRVVKPGGRIVLLGPTWDLPFWYPNAVRSKARSFVWRVQYAARRFVRQMAAQLGFPSPFLIVAEPDALKLPFVYDSDAVYVVWTFEVVRALRKLGCVAVHMEVDTQLLGTNSVIRFLKRFLMALPAYRHAGSTSLMIFERE